MGDSNDGWRILVIGYYLYQKAYAERGFINVLSMISSRRAAIVDIL